MQLKDATKEQLIEELIKRTGLIPMEFLMGKWNTIYIDDRIYSVKINDITEQEWNGN
jgi:hypothetical protein